MMYAGALATADHAHGGYARGCVPDHRLLPPALDHRAIVPDYENKGLRHRSGADRREWPLREPYHRDADRCRPSAANGARARWRGRTTAARCNRHAGPARAGSNLPKPRRQDPEAEESSSKGIPGIRRLGVRPPRWLDRLLRQTGTYHDDARTTIPQGHAQRLEAPNR